MKTVTPTDLRNHLSRHLRLVRSGEEIVVVSRGEPVARILLIPKSISQEERELVAAGIMKLPEKPVRDWKRFVDRFFAKPAPGRSRAKRIQERLTRAVVEEREESW